MSVLRDAWEKSEKYTSRENENIICGLQYLVSITFRTVVNVWLEVRYIRKHGKDNHEYMVYDGEKFSTVTSTESPHVIHTIGEKMKYIPRIDCICVMTTRVGQRIVRMINEMRIKHGPDIVHCQICGIMDELYIFANYFILCETCSTPGIHHGFRVVMENRKVYIHHTANK